MGLTISITCVAEVPVFHFTGWLLEAVGVKIVLHGVLAVYVLRLLYYSILQHLVRPGDKQANSLQNPKEVFSGYKQRGLSGLLITSTALTCPAHGR